MIELTDNEIARYNEFVEKHHKCAANARINGGDVSIIYTPMTYGYTVMCRCNWCGEHENITDYD